MFASAIGIPGLASTSVSATGLGVPTAEVAFGVTALEVSLGVGNFDNAFGVTALEISLGVGAFDTSFGVGALDASLGVGAFDTSFGVGAFDTSFGVGAFEISLGVGSFGISLGVEASLGVGTFEASLGVATLVSSLGVATLVSFLGVANSDLLVSTTGDATGLWCFDAEPHTEVSASASRVLPLRAESADRPERLTDRSLSRSGSDLTTSGTASRAFPLSLGARASERAVLWPETERESSRGAVSMLGNLGEGWTECTLLELEGAGSREGARDA